MLTLESPFLKRSLSELKGVGASIQTKLEKLGLHTFGDLLFHLPLHYQDRTHVLAIRDLKPGFTAVVQGEIDDIQLIQKRRKMLVISLYDGTGNITLRFFHFYKGQIERLAVGKPLRCFGEVREGYQGLEMVHPEYHALDQQKNFTAAEHLTPVYPSTEGFSQQSIRNLMIQVVEQLEEGDLAELIPERFRNEFELPHLIDSLKFVHQPPPEASRELLEQGKHPAQQRLAFEELLAHHISLRRLRLAAERLKARAFAENQALLPQFFEAFGFKLTGAQERVLHDIYRDLAQAAPMNRLIQGDVGSGKTVVAALAMLQAIINQSQSVLMAPTDLLAEQHVKNLERWFKPLGYSVAWLAGKHKGKVRKKTLEQIASGEVLLIVGTHAVFQEGVHFHQLGLIVIDEQHRFGVHQRLALREKAVNEDVHPHQLVMTATPIPRTLAMTLYADLDVSVIDELPPGRKPITTVAISNQKREEVVQRLYEQCRQGKQAYWVCTLIEESEALTSQAAEVLWQQLTEQLPDLRIGLVHGRLKADAKEQVMHAFKNHDLDVLVATTVIEVGVDVPNASLMIIENAERLGLSQLHQLRGRVGRGSEASFCVLLYQPPLSETAKKRLQVMRDTQDGFEIARQDLTIRGPGELLGTKQTGAVRLRIADFARDQALLPNVQRMAEKMLREAPESIESLLQRWLPMGEELGRV